MQYCLIGILNTAVHWAVFFLGYYWGDLTQATANLVAFLCAVHLSYYLNTKFNFSRPLSLKRYVLFITFMSGLSVVVGAWGDAYTAWPILTLVVFSASSVVLGFLFSKFIVFRG